jgi:NADH-quinone oxidoreductase subunit L
MVVAWIGALTALWAALVAAAEHDIKRVLAYSTISQLGYMFLAAGVGAYAIAIFHLVTHAFFKAAMFLAAGAVMHGTNGETDMRALGGLRRAMPVTAATMAAGGLALSGILPFAGFFSKDAILASAWVQGEYALWGLGLVTAGLTAFYMSRLYLSVFEGRGRAPEPARPHDPGLTMTAALVPLAALSLVGGAVNLPGVFTLDDFLAPVVGAAVHPSGLAVWLLGAVALLVALTGIGAGASLYLARAGSVRRRSLKAFLGPIATGAQDKFYVDELYGRAFVLPGKAFAAWCSDVFDARGIDGIADGIGRGIASLAEGTRRIQTGYVRNYALVFFIGVIALMSIVTIRLVGG